MRLWMTLFLFLTLPLLGQDTPQTSALPVMGQETSQSPALSRQDTPQTSALTRDQDNSQAPALSRQDTPQTSSPTPEEVAADTGRFMGEFFKMLLVLGAMVLVLYFVSWYIKKLNVTRFEKGNDQSLIKIVERRAIAPRVNIYVLDIEGRTLVVGESPHGLARLSEYPTEGNV